MKKKKDNTNKLSRSKKNLIFYCLMMIYPVVQFCVFYIGVNFNSIILAFKEYSFDSSSGIATGEYTWVWFKNFGNFFYELGKPDSILPQIFLNSFKVYIIHVCISSTLSLFFAYYIFKNKFASGFFRVVLFLPSVISPIVFSVIFFNLVNFAIPEMFGCKPLLTGFDNSTNFSVMMFYYIWVGFGTSILVYNGTMAGIDVSVMEAAQLDGVKGIREFITIIFPLIFPTFSTFFITNLALIFSNQFNAHAFFGELAPPQVKTIGYYLFVEVSKGGSGLQVYPKLSAIGLFLTAILVPVTLLVKYGLRKLESKISY